ncbi:hypothetical protein [Mycobacterium asiaticum]|nr:hypothetical protein [Mycobacterium asiaticum]
MPRAGKVGQLPDPIADHDDGQPYREREATVTFGVEREATVTLGDKS